MPRPLMQEPAPHARIPGARRRRYLVMCRQNLWFIAFGQEEFGPYQSEREAMLFAVDAAHRLGEQGEVTQVLEVDETGNAEPVWTHGLDSYPPALR
jgi:hypothetical protein